MDDENKAVNTTAQEGAVQEVASPQTEAKEVEQTSDSTDQAQSGESSTDGQSKEEVNSSADGQKQPTRRDKRIQKLIEKLKTKDAPVTDQEFAKALGIDPNAPLINQNEIEQGIDPAVLENRQRQREMLVERRAKNSAIAEIEFKGAVKDHLADAEQTLEKLKDDEILDELVADQYHALNYITDPFSGKEYFVPKVKMSDIYAKQQKMLEQKIARATADTSARLSDQSQEGAVRQSATGDSGEDHDLDASFQDAKESGSTEKWAQYLKKLGI